MLECFKNNPKGTRVEAANAHGDITEDVVKFVTGKLLQKGLLKRAGGRKHGEWKVLIYKKQKQHVTVKERDNRMSPLS